MFFPLLWVLVLTLATLIAPQEQKSGSPSDGYHNDAAFTQELYHLVEKSPDACRLAEIGRSPLGRPLWCLTLGRGDAVDARTAVLIVAGLDAQVPASSELALAVATEMLQAPESDRAALLLDKVTFFILPRMNPDGLEAFFAPVLQERIGTPHPWDDDRDGRNDEDDPDDLNCDGQVTLMRALDPEGAWIPDPAEPRLMKKAESEKGEAGRYKLLPEGLDDDGDEEYNEDGVGFVDLNMNFPHGYQEHTLGTGLHAISEAESKALIDFVLSHPQIAAAITYGRHDNLQKISADGRKDLTGEAPVALLKEDAKLYEQMADLLKKAVGERKAPGAEPGGAFYEWAYAQAGIPSFSVRPWTRPDEKRSSPAAPRSETRGDNPKKENAAVPGPGGEPKTAAPPDGGSGEKDPEGAGWFAPRPSSMVAAGEAKKEQKPEEEKVKPADEEAAAWLSFSDEVRGGAGFLEWAPFEHPQLGKVEIGGFVPYFRQNPPFSEMAELTAGHAAFALDVAERLPKLRVALPEVKTLSPGVYEVTLRLFNEGRFPTALEIGRAARSVRPVVIRPQVPKDWLLSGSPVERAWSIPGGEGCATFRWILQAPEGSTCPIDVSSDRLGSHRVEALLGAAETPP